MNVILIGYMGSGKSTVGKLLAEKLQMKFIDSDSEIEKEEGMTIPEIFESKGESHFRELEVEFLLHNEFDNSVIATGGGMPCFHNNMDRINLIGKSVYLEVSPEVIVDRISSNISSRPVLADKTSLESIKTHLDSRKMQYEMASFKIDAASSLQHIVDGVMLRL